MLNFRPKCFSIAAASLVLLGIWMADTPATAQEPAPTACPAPTRSFTDVPDSHFAQADIECLVALGIINGTSATAFSPDKQITRAQTAALLARMLRRQGQTCFTSADVFTDVATDYFAKVDIECLSALGIINGTSATKFSPDRRITRAQTAALLARMLRRQGQVCFTGADVFADVPSGHFAKVDIECLSALGIINGTSATKFSPDRRITRAQTAALLARMWRRAAAVPTETLQDDADDADGGDGGGPPAGGPPSGGPPGGAPGPVPPSNSAPGRPGRPTLANQDQGLGVSWTAPANGGVAITDYDVEYRVEDADLNRTGKQPSPWMLHAHTGTGTAATIGSLANGTDYEVRVRAENSLGEGQWSQPATDAPAGVPAAPGAPAVATMHQSLAVSWIAPASNGAAITDYDVRYRACTATDGDTSVKTCATNPTWGAWTDRSGETNTDTATTATISGLTNGTAYQVQVRATNSAGDSAWSASAGGTPAAQPPSAPNTIKQTVAQGFKVSWAAPASNGAPITGYEVRYRVENSNGEWPVSWTFYAETDATTTSITIFLPGSTSSAGWQALTEANISGSNAEASRQAFMQTNTAGIQAQVRAINNVGEGDWSAQPPDAPAAPQLAPAGTRLTATWSAPASNGAPITDYDVRHRACTATAGDTSVKTCATNPTWGNWTDRSGETSTDTNTTATISGLTNGTAYQVQVRATNRAGDSAWSAPATGTPAAEKPNRPDAPVVAAKSQGLGVSWTAPANNGGSAITDYDVQYRACTATDGDTSVKTCSTNPTWEANWTDRTGETSTDTATSANITGLTDGTAYQVRVRAANSVGESEWSPVSKATPATGGTPAPKPPDRPAAPTLDARNRSLGVSWTAPAINGSAVTGYSVRFRITDTDNNQTGDQPGNWMYQGHTDTSTLTVIESLTNGVSYQAQVLARSQAGDSAWSSSAAAAPAAQKPDQPVAPTVIVWNRSLRVSWTAPASNGAAVTDFDLRWRACTATDKSCASSPTWGSWTDRGNETTPDPTASARITGLTNGTAYQVQVRAANSVGESEWSLSATGQPAAQRPGRPSKPMATPWHRSLRISWTAPDDNGADISDYDVQYRACTATPRTCATNPAWGAWTDRTGESASDTATTDTITGLTNGTAYQVRLRAANSAGESVWSPSSDRQIPAVQEPDKPDAPTVSVWNVSLRISWTAPEDNGATISDYDVQYRACTATPLTCATNPTWGSWSSHTHTGTGTSATIGSLTNGTAYQVQVQATNSVGDSAWSDSAQGIPAVQTPDAPAAPTLTVDNQSLGVSWAAPEDNGAAISDYDVQYRACTATPLTCATNPTWGSWSSHTHTGTGTSATIGSLTNGTAYQVQVQATNSVGDSAWSASAKATPTAQTPDAPTAPTITVWNKSLNVSWTAPADNGAALTDYNVQYRKQNSDDTWPNTWTAHSHTGTATSTTIAGLTNDSDYQVQVQAVNSVGDSAWSASTEATPTAQKPDAPAAPTLTVANQSLGVSWTAPADNGASISDYDVRYRACTATPKTCTSSPTWGSWSSHSHTGTGTTATIGSLTNGTAYQVQVQATNSVGDGAWSASASEYPSTTPGAPAAPTLTVKHQSLDVSWSAPSSNGGSAVTGYKVGRCSANCGTDSNWTTKTLTGTGTTTTLTGLTNGTAYQVRVRATNRSGDSTWSASATATPARVPDTPSAPSLTKGARQLAVSWNAPADNGSSITDYDVRHRIKDTDQTQTGDQPGSWTTLTGAADPGSATTATITGLTNGTAYQVQVRATNSIGDSTWSTSSEAAPEDKPAQPAAPTLTYGDQSLGVSWNAPADNGQSISGYGVQYRACTATPKTCTSSPTWGSWSSHSHTGTGTTATIGSLTNGTAYQVQVRATNSVGDGAWSASASQYPSTTPGAPAAPTLTVKHQSLDVSWSAPSSNGGSAVTGYKVGRCSANCGTDSNWTTKTLTGTGKTTTLGSLTNGTAYQVRVRATNRGGDGTWSASATATPAKAPDKPAAPTVGVWNKSLNVSWTAPASNGAAITDYDVQYQACTATPLTCATNPTWGTWTDRSGETDSDTATSAAVTGLTNGTAYQVRVRASNSAGDSTWSDASAKKTPTAQKPAAPAAPTLTYGDQSLGVSWSEPADNGADISGYKVRHCDNSTGCDADSEWTTTTLNSTGTSTTLSSLTNGTTYQVQVRATNSVGDGAWSVSASEYPSTTPGTPAAPALTVNDESLGVSWSAPASNGGSAITGYKVGRCSTSCGTDSNWTVKTLTTTGTTTSLSSLTNGTAYQVRVAATNRGGDGAWSTTATATPARVPDKPAAPTVGVWNKSLNVSWTAPASNGAAITGYDVQYRACTQSADLTCATNPTWGSWASRTHTGTGTSTTIGSLTNGTAYQVQVQATNSVGDSGWSTATTATPAAQTPDAPAAPSLTVDNQSLEVSWTAPADNGAAVTDYDVQYRACTQSADLTCATNPTWGSWASHAHTGTGVATTIGSLTNGTAHQVQVRAVNSVGDGAWSTSAQAAPAPQPPERPAAASVSARHQGLAVSWTAPSLNGSAITGYGVQYRACTQSADLTCATNATWGSWASHAHTGTGVATTIGSLTNGTAYQVQVRAKSAAGNSAWSDSTKQTPAIQAPDAPGAPTLTVWNKSLTVSWTAPSLNGSAITDYDVQYRACTATPKTCAGNNPAWGAWTDRTGETSADTATSVTVAGLTNTTAYQVRVRAANSVGESGWSTAGEATPVAQKPSTPAAPTLTHGDESLTASWTAPADNGATITDYDVRYCDNSTGCDAASEWTALNDTGDNATDTSTTATIGSLTNGTTYQVQVRAANSVGDSDWSASATEYPSTAPDTPAKPSLTVKDQSLDVSWSAPSGNGGSAVTGYKVQYRVKDTNQTQTGDQPGEWQSHAHTGTGTTATIGSLTNGTAYQVQVRATNRSGDSAWSASTDATPAKKPDAPAAPTLTKGARQLTASWTAPADNGAPITDYDVRYRVKDTDQTQTGDQPGSWTTLTGAADPGSATTATITGLTNGTAYQVQVRATNSVGDSGWGASAGAAPEDKPAKPTKPTLTHGDQSLDVSWTAPADNGQAITDYDVQYRACTATPKTCTGNNPTWGAWTDRSGETNTDTATSVTISGLTNGTAYGVQVRATNSVGDGAWSTAASEHPSTTPDTPGKPSLTVKDQSLDVSWNAPSGDGGSAVTDYDVQYRACTTSADLTCAANATWGDWTEWDAADTSTTTSATVTGLTNGTAYQVQVRAGNRSGDGAWSTAATATPAKAPDTPAAPTVTAWHQALRVAWTAPTANGAPITDYDVQYSACTQSTDLTCANNPTWGAWTDRSGETNTDTTTSASVTGLTNGTAYQIQVRAANSVGESGWSTATAGTPAVQKPDAPAAPTLTVDNASLGVSWTAPTTNGAPITDYDVQYRACTQSADLTCASNPTWGAWTDRSGETNTDTATSATISGLTNGTAYEVQVRAANSVGESGWSTSSTASPAPQAPDAPAAPTLTVKHISLGVSWTAPADNGATVTDYDVQYRVCTQSADLTCANNPTWGAWTDRSGETTADTATTVTITGLTNGTAYEVQVRAANSVGDSGWSTSSTAVPAVQPPDTPAAPTVTALNTSVGVSWQAPSVNGSAITGYHVQYRACTATPTTCTGANPAWGNWASHTHTGTGTGATITGLTNGTAYQVQVRARSAAGDSGWSLSGSGTPTPQPPDGLRLPSLTHGNKRLIVSWSAPKINGSAITGYNVQYRVKDTDQTQTGDQPGAWQSHSHTGTGTTATITGLTNGTAYEVQVQATSTAGDSSWSSSASATPSTTPTAPSVTLSGVAGSPTSTRVSWSVANDGGSDITGYEIDYRCNPGNGWAIGRDEEWSVTAGTTSRDSTIPECASKLSSTSYRFRVRASNANGWSTWTNPYVATSSPVAIGASEITTTITGTSMAVSWTASADGGLEITDYDVRYRVKDTDQTQTGDQPGAWTTLSGSDDPGSATTVTISGLTAATVYQVQVRATNAMGTNSWSASKNWPQPPAAAGASTLTVWNESLTVAWTAPAANGAAITDYDVQYRACTATPKDCTGNDPAWGAWTDRTGETTADTATSVTLTGLTNNTAYQVQVRAANFAGEAAWSPSSSATPAIQPPDAPAAPALAVSSTTSLGVSWTAPAANGAAISDYDVRYRACTATPKSCAGATPTWGAWTDRTGETAADTATTVTLAGLTKATAYQVQVRAANSVGESAWSPSATEIPAAAPAAPAAPTLTVKHQALGVSWSAPADDGGSALTDYDVQYQKCNTSGASCSGWGAWTDRTGETTADTATSVTLTGLTNDYEYRVRVRASNPAGTGAWSAASAAAAPAPQAPDASAPTVAARHQGLAVSWTAATANGSAVTDYDVRYRACTATPKSCASRPTWGAWTTLSGGDDPGTALEAAVIGLTNGTAYQVQVRATNSIGTGAWSASTSATPAPQAPEAPAAPKAEYRSGSLVVSWKAPTANGSAISDYDVQYRACTATDSDTAVLTCATKPTWGSWSDRSGETATDTATSVTVTGLTNGTAYQVQVRAANSIGESGWSASGEGTPAPKPGTPGDVSVATSDGPNNDGSFTVSWTAPSGPVDRYEILYELYSSVINQWLSSNNGFATGKDNTSFTLTGWQNNIHIGQKRRAQVRAENKSGWSGTSSWVEFYVIGLPPVPTNVSLTVKVQSLDVTWRSPTNNSGSAISDYDVRYRACTATDSDTAVLTCATKPTWGSWSEWNANDTSTATSATITGLTNGTAYQVQVRSENSANDSAWSSSAKATPADEPDAPSAPTLTVKNQALGVSWTAPDDGGSAITDYDVQYRACTKSGDLTCASDPDWGSWTDHAHTGTTTSATITGLTNSTAYQVQVRATNSPGDSGWSSSAKAVPVPQKPDAPGAPTLVVWNKELRASWTAPVANGAAITDYDVQYRACTKSADLTCASDPSWGSWSEWNANDTSTSTSATVTGLTNGTAYQVQVRAGNSVGDGAWSDSAKATPTAQKPATPGAPTLTHGNASLSVSWTAPADNGSAITGYRVRRCDDSLDCSASSSNWRPKDITGTGTSTTLTGLTNGTTYQVQVRAHNSVGNGQFSTSSKEYPSTVPAAPAAPTLTFGSRQLDVSWSAPANNGSAITGYKVGRCSANCGTGSNWTVVTLTGTGTSTTLSGLTNGTTYQVRVAATNRSGDGAWSANASESPANKPGKPAKPTVTRGNRQVTASWTAPADGGAAITDYNVEYREQNKSAVDHPFTGNGTTTTITGLTNGKRYQVRVQSVNKAGESGWSQWSDLATPATVPSAPGAPTLDHGVASLSVSWTAPADNGDAIDDYDVQYRACTKNADLKCASDPTWGSWTDHAHTGTGTTATITGLTNGTAYQVQVRAANSVGDGSWSTSAKEHPSTVPGAPAAPTLTVWHASLSVSWTAPTSDGGSAVTGYKVRHCDNGTGCDAASEWTTKNVSGGSTTTTTVSGLTNGTTYQVQVSATNRSGTGAWSASTSDSPAPQKPDQPAAPTLTVKNLSLGVSWTAPASNGANITDYDVQYRKCTATPKSCATSPTWGAWTSHAHTGTGTTATIGSLTNGTAYQVQVQATNSIGDSLWSPSAKATPATTPGAPGRPTLTVGAQQLGVSWSAPSSNGGAAITGYKVQHCDQSTGCDADDEWTTDTHTGTGTTATITGLTNGTTYRVRVAATNSVGDSTWSSYRTGKPKDKPATPDAPTVVSGNLSLAVSWTAPADNGSNITGYKVRYCGGENAECWNDDSSDWKEKSASGTSTTITGLTNATTYRVKVRARNALGDGPWSSETEGTPGAPAAPSRPSLTEGNNQLAATWTAPSNRGDTITAYGVEYCDSSNDCTDDSNWTDDSPSDVVLSHTITGLTNGTTYKVRVRAQNLRGWGGWSSEATATPATVPGQPNTPTLTAKSRKLDVAWTAPTETGGSAISGYSVRYCDDSTGCDATNEWTVRTVSSGSTTTYTISGLTNGKTYQVQVAARNRKGTGAWSSSASATPAALPSKPTNLTVEAAHQSLKVTWTASVGNGSTISGYEVEYRKQNSDNTWPSTWTSHSHGSTDTYTTIDSLTNGSKYQVRVQADSNNGKSGWTSAVSGTPKAVPDAPDAPTLTSGDRKIDLSWSPPNNNNGSAVTDYDVRYRKQNSNSTWPSSWTTLSHTGTATTASMTGLTNGSAYQVQVRAQNANGESPWSTAATETPAGKPAKPATPTVAAGDQQLTVTWTAPSSNGSAITSYSVQYCDSSNDCTDDTNWTDDSPFDTSTSHTISGLTNGTAYKVRVRATNNVGDSAWSTEATGTPAGKPSAPENLEFVSGGGFLTVSWTTAANGSTISGHKVRYCNTNDSNKDCYSDYEDWTTVSVSGTTTSRKITGLTNGDYYDVQVRANSNQGDSDWSSSSGGTPGAPAKPTITLTAGDDQFTVTWTAPSSNGDDITSYEVEYCNQTNGDCTAGNWNTEYPWDTSTRSLDVTGLDDKSQYKVRVRASNGRGSGEWSTIKTVTTT